MATGLQLAQEVTALTEQVLKLVGNQGYKAPVMLHAAGQFFQNQSAVQKLIFNVPADGDFFAQRLNLYLQYRIVDTTSVPGSDLTFRPCNWSSVGHVYDSPTSLALPACNAKVAFRDDTNGKYQSAPFNVASLYSSPFGLTQGIFAGVNTMYRGGLDFKIPHRLGRGKAAELEVTPLYAFIAGLDAFFTANPADRAEFRVLGVLRGFKNVRAFK